MIEGEFLKVSSQISATWAILSAKRKAQCLILLGTMILVMFIEIISIGSILPFLTALSNISLLKENFYIRYYLVEYLQFTDFGIVVLFGTLFFLITIVSNGARVGLLLINTRFSYAIGADFSLSAFTNVLYQPYSIHLSRNSATVINRIIGQIATLVSSILLFLNLVSSLITLLFLTLLISFINLKGAIFIYVILCASYLSIYFYVRPKLNRASERVSESSEKIMRILQEGLGGIRDIILDGTQKYFSKIFEVAEQRLRRAQGNIVILSSGPKFIIETVGVFLLLCLSVIVFRSKSADLIVPILGTVAFSAQRILPLFQQIFSSWSGIVGNSVQARNALDLLHEKKEAIEFPEDNELSINFENSIELRNISYSYPSGECVLSNISLTIRKGEKIGIIGASGSGKSTLLDVVMGLLIPSSGEIKVDDLIIRDKYLQGWRSKIAHVPQSLYLADASIAENIAFGVPKSQIQYDKVIKCAEFARIDTVVNQWPAKYHTNVGERGSRLSGGQRQRVGVARALYKNASIILFDEATSALDGETESQVMESIEGIDRSITIIMIAHRLSTLQGCSKIVQIDRGRIVRVGQYEEFSSKY